MPVAAFSDPGGCSDTPQTPSSPPAPIVGYPGSKGANGVAERIISLMPAHSTYVEMGFGGGAIYRLKKPAARSILVDLDGEIQREWGSIGVIVTGADMTRPETWPPSLLKAMADPNTVSFWDPPYLRSTRTCKRDRYRFEMQEEVDHRRLLNVIKGVKAKVLLSGYWSSLYAEMLQDWRTADFWAGTRGCKRREWVWMNYPDGLPLHDTRFVGEGFRERERIKRKKQRWVRMLMEMDPAERGAILDAIALETRA